MIVQYSGGILSKKLLECCCEWKQRRPGAELRTLDHAFFVEYKQFTSTGKHYIAAVSLHHGNPKGLEILDKPVHQFWQVSVETRDVKVWLKFVTKAKAIISKYFSKWISRIQLEHEMQML